jgi:folylpolyglutamate synthase/dihydropteroate synthase
VGILGALVPLAARVILTRASNARAADPSALRAAMPPTSARVDVAPSAAEALRMARAEGRTPAIVVAGSLFLVADVLTHLAGAPDKPCPIEKGAASMESLFP